jgi:hypothetical protein
LNYSADAWTYAYTDISTTNSISNGCRGIVLRIKKCGPANMTVEYDLQNCIHHVDVIRRMWSKLTNFKEKLYGGTDC